jgi:GNAT superfamily N-acetyltransferase
MFNNMRRQACVVFEHPSCGAVALSNPGKPLWLWCEDVVSDEDMRLFFDAFLQKHPPPQNGIISNTSACTACAEIIRRDYKTRELAAYYLNKPRMSCYKSGYLRPATPADAPFVNEWVTAFYTDALMTTPLYPTQTPAITKRVNNAEAGTLYIWQDGDTPCAMGMLCEPADGLCRLNLIYTPAHMRGQKYGKAMVSALSRLSWERKVLPFLFTDTRNAIANRLYLSLGFKQAGTLLELIFD